MSNNDTSAAAAFQENETQGVIKATLDLGRENSRDSAAMVDKNSDVAQICHPLAVLQCHLEISLPYNS